MDSIFQVIAGTITGGAMGAILTKYFTEWREVRNRKREFLSFLGTWRIHIQRVTKGDMAGTYNKYVGSVPEFGGHIAKLHDAFPKNQKEFDIACSGLVHLLPDDITNANGDCRLIIVSKIERLIAFCSKA